MLLSLPVSKNILYPNKFNLHYPQTKLNVDGNLYATLNNNDLEQKFIIRSQDIRKPMTQIDRTIRDNDIEERRMIINKNINNKQQLENLMLNEFRQRAKDKRDEKIKDTTDNMIIAMKQNGLIDPSNEEEMRATLQRDIVARQVGEEQERILQTATARGNANRAMEGFISQRLSLRERAERLRAFDTSRLSNAGALDAQPLNAGLSRNADELRLSLTGQGITPSPQAQLLGRTTQSRAPISYSHVAGEEGAGGAQAVNFSPSPNLNFSGIARKAEQASKNQELLQAVRELRNSRIHRVKEELKGHNEISLRQLNLDVNASGEKKILAYQTKKTAVSQLANVLKSSELTPQQRKIINQYTFNETLHPKTGNKEGSRAGKGKA